MNPRNDEQAYQMPLDRTPREILGNDNAWNECDQLTKAVWLTVFAACGDALTEPEILAAICKNGLGRASDAELDAMRDVALATMRDPPTIAEIEVLPDNVLAGLLVDKGGHPVPVSEVRAWLQTMRANGDVYIPVKETGDESKQ